MKGIRLSHMLPGCHRGNRFGHVVLVILTTHWIQFLTEVISKTKQQKKTSEQTNIQVFD